MSFRRTTHGAIDVIHGSVPLNVAAGDAFSGIADQCFETGTARVIVDLREVSLIDSRGLELLADLQDRCLRSGSVMKVAAPNPLCREILRVTGLERRIEVFADTATAMGSYDE